MPTIIHLDGRRVQDPAEAAAIIQSLGLTVAGLDLAAAAPTELEPVLRRQRLDNWRAEAILADLANALPPGYAGRDVVALFPDTDGLDSILAAFHRTHVHDDDEIRLILAGEGVFGFVLPDGDQVEITVVPGDLVGVPAGAEHWFRLTESRTVVAVRLFGTNPDWRARYTDTPIRFPH
ncbi:acireductone dioxygenase [Paramagnetospirillum kuznetsovii]|uniref:acireductone dioxygenase (Fe(2+)-requiring) n=1 Tax=Paramagnetospirillum kuznetsovii TaxID=2053833 RepID=A0A364NUI0_9PROT|nr:cupin domain-containing protein [Paramagnetospirillum kuznetsovii]RAU20547.1 acireductone dioxygenase [Paramagnetospirillum kuznetsovii]